MVVCGDIITTTIIMMITIVIAAVEVEVDCVDPHDLHHHHNDNHHQG